MKRLLLSIVLLVMLLAGCNTVEVATEPVKDIPPINDTLPTKDIPPAGNLLSSITESEPQIQITGGLLLWHRTLPQETFTLEDIAIEIYNYGDFAIEVLALEIIIDGEGHTYRLDSMRVDPGPILVQPEEKIEVAIQPMLGGYHNGNHIIVIKLLSPSGAVLYTHPETHLKSLTVKGTG